MASFKVNGKEYDLPQNLTLGEAADCERHWGVNFAPEAGMNISKAAALMWIGIRREDPTVTLDDIRDLPLEVFADVMAAAGDAGPPEEEKSSPRSDAGATSSGNGAHDLGKLPSVSGSPSSDTGSASDLVTSAN